jgi:spore germination protein GerM
VRTLAALVVCCGLAGCGGDQEGVSIWLTTDGGSLREATRDVEPRPALALRALLAGPTAAERDRGLRTDLPARIQLVSSSLRGGTVRVELRSDDLGRYEPSTLVFALRLSQLVYTLTGLPRVDRVQLVVNGEPWGFNRHDGSIVRTYARASAPRVCNGRIWVGEPPDGCR